MTARAALQEHDSVRPTSEPTTPIKLEAEDGLPPLDRSPASRHRKLAAIRAPSLAPAEPSSSKSTAASPAPPSFLALPADSLLAASGSSASPLSSSNSVVPTTAAHAAPVSVAIAAAIASAPSTRASTPALASTPRSRRRKKHRSAAGSVTPRPPLPSLDSADRRRSGRIAKASASSAVANEPAALSDLAAFGFSPYLEGLILGNRVPERRTRSGVRSVRPVVGRNGAGKKEGRGKAKGKEEARDKDDDGPEEDAKAELYLQLCILSYQLQAELEMVPFKTVEQLRVEFLAQTSHSELHDQSNEATDRPRATSPHMPDGWPPTPPQQANHWSIASSPNKATANALPNTSAGNDQNVDRTLTASPPSSPEMPLMASLASYRRPPEMNGFQAPWINGDHAMHNLPSAPVSVPISAPRHVEPASTSGTMPWHRESAESIEASPIVRPSRPNIMSISALMSAPSPPRRPQPKPRPAPHPPSPRPPPPPAAPIDTLAEWTQEDDLATSILQGLARDTRELGLLDPSAGETITRSGTQTPAMPEDPPVPFEFFDPHQMDTLARLDLSELFSREEDEYTKEREACSELYVAMRYLAVYDDVVDRWRATELSKLRRQIRMRKDEVGRLLSADRDAAWTDFYNDRDSKLVKEEAMRLVHQRWQAESEVNRIAYQKPRSRALAKVREGLFVPPGRGAANLSEGRKLYRRYGSFLSGSRHLALESPLVRSDLAKIRQGVGDASRSRRSADNAAEPVAASPAKATQTRRPTGADATDEGGDDEEALHAESSEDESESGSESSSASGITSLPSFSSVFSDSDSETTRQDELSSANGGSAMDVDVDGADGADDASDDSNEDEDENEDVALMTLRQMQDSDHTVERPLKRKRRSPPPDVRWWKAGRVME